MANNEETKIPKNGPKAFGGPGRKGNAPAEKAKDFKSAIKRLFLELKSYKIVIAIALVLAIIGAILAITAPNKLSKLTDEISNGLKINKDNIDALTGKISENITSDEMKSTINQIINLDFSKQNMEKISANSSIPEEDKQKYRETMKTMEEAKAEFDKGESVKRERDKKEFNPLKYIAEIPESILRAILSESTYKDRVISVDDKIVLIKGVGQLYNANKTNLKVPESMKDILFKDVEIDGQKITIEDQYIFVTELSAVRRYV